LYFFFKFGLLVARVKLKIGRNSFVDNLLDIS